MTDVEVVLTDLGEIATRELAKKHKPQGLKENLMNCRKVKQKNLNKMYFSRDKYGTAMN